MTFTPTTVEPSPESKVTVTFAGLMLLKPGPDNTLEVGIHKYSRDHAFQVMLIVNKPDRPPRPIRLCSGPLFSDFEMIVEPGPVPGVQKFVTDEDAFDPNAARNCALDFRWAINFSTLPGHEGVEMTDGARPVARLNTGVLYTPNLSRENLNQVLAWGGHETPLHQFSADLAAAVDIPQDHGMTLRWNELGKVTEIPLPRDGDPDGTTYTVALMNDPPYYDPTDDHDEFTEYYKILRIGDQEVPEQFQCDIRLAGGQKSDEIPCLAGVMDPPGGPQ